MVATDSNLSNYGYDLVVSTTQASLNSTLWEWLVDMKQPMSYICFLKSSNPGGGPLQQITLDELKTRSGGVNPFEIPDQTAQSDPRIVKLNNANFAGAFKMKVGVPPGMTPKDLPIVILGTSASSILFTMYCSHLSVVQNSPGAWTVSTQPDGTPWSMRTTLGLVSQDLDVTLDIPYFQNTGAKHKAALLANLNALTQAGDPFSLQQLLLDFNNASAISPSSSFIPNGSLASTMLTQSFFATYISSVEQNGSPPLSVKAMTSTADIRQAPAIQEYNSVATVLGLNFPLNPTTDSETDPSQLALTAVNWEVSPPINTAVPTPESQDATTLNYLCAVNGHQLPPPAAFSWSWVEPQDVDTESGIVAINRHVIANHILQQILPTATKCCVLATYSCTAHWDLWATYYWNLYPSQRPQTVIITPSGTGPTVIQISYSQDTPSHLETAQTCTAAIQILPSYTCTVTFDKKVIKVEQHMVFRVYVRLDSTSQTRYVVDKTITDEYRISVDQNGSLQTTQTSLPPVDKSESPGGDWWTSTFTNIADLMSDIQKNITAFAATELAPIPFDSLQNFIFPGARVFTFKSAEFSSSQDLVCAITYVDPNAAHKKTKPASDATTPSSTPASTTPPRNSSSQPVVAPGFPIPPQQPSSEPVVAPGFPIPPQQPSSQPVVAPGFPIPSGTDTKIPKSDPSKHDGAPAKTHTSGDAGKDHKDHKDPASTKSDASASGTKTSNGQSSGTADFGTYSLAYSSDLIQNYIQGETVSPQGKFEAVQTSDGHTLLFSVSTSGILSVIQESSGTSNTGWVTTDISTATLQGPLSGATVRTFDVGQSALDETIGLAMAVSSQNSDNLFIALSNSNSDTSWISNPTWVVCPFDAPNESRDNISIYGILFTETVDKQEYLIVDIDRSSGGAVTDIERYYINPSKANGTYWTRHDVPVDIQSGDYQSCVGRKAGGLVDGVYTIGKAGSSAQFIYEPIINAYGNGPPTPSRFSLPGDSTVSAIAAARNDSGSSEKRGTTDLFAIGGSTLYCLDASAQRSDGAVGKPVLTNAVLIGTSQIIVMTNKGITTIWGRNASDVVYYTSCPAAKTHVSGSWANPTPILSGIEKISAYVNRSDGGNTVFAAGGGNLQKLLQATATTSKLWQAQAITVAAPPMQPSLKFKSYTTSLQLQGPNNAVASGVSVTLSAKSRSPVYINGLYYVLGPVPINVPADNNGMLIVAEAITKINGTVIQVSVGGAPTVPINPMEQAFKKLAALNTSDALKSASIPQGTVAGGFQGPPQAKPFVSPSVSDDNVSAAASSMSALKQAYDGLNSPKTPATPKTPTASTAAVSHATPVPPTKALVSLPNANVIDISPGDLLQWGESEFNFFLNYAIQIVHDAGTDVWTFVTDIAGQAYRAVLDSIETVVAAVEWVFNQIETIIEDIILFLELLLAWDDIKRTKDVMCNLTKLYMNELIYELPTVQTWFDGQITGLESTINSWSGVQNWPSFGSSGSQPLTGSSSSSALSNLTTTGHMFIGHLTDNASAMTSTTGNSSMTVAQEIFQDLATALQEEGEVVQAIGQQFQALAGEITTMSADEVIKRLIGIIADAVLSSVQIVVDCLLKVLCQMSTGIIDALDTPVYIPILSDILSELGVPPLSILDLLLWIGAIVTTLAYKITHDNEAPFTDDALPGQIASASSLESLKPILSQTTSQQDPSSSTSTTVSRVAVHAVSRDAQPSDPPPFENDAARKWFAIGHGNAGCWQVIRTITSELEAATEDPSIELSALSILPGAITTIWSLLGNLFGLKEAENDGLRYSNWAFSGLTVLQMIGLSSFAIKQMGWDKSVSAFRDPRTASSSINALLVIPSLIISCLHLQEINDQSSDDDKIPARLDESSNMVNYFGRWMYSQAVLDTNPEAAKGIALIGLFFANSAVAAIQLTEAFDYLI
ncbi:hypothetical protein MMC25_008316 [Agyrium rufum]|nr:hypothetical protein [Agyrium rufum]